jgi:hypothetical protein
MSPQETMEGGALVRQLTTYLEDVDQNKAPHNACAAHWPIQNGIRLLMQCELAELAERAQDREERRARQLEADKQRRDTFWQVTGAAIGSASVIATIISLCLGSK